jgi:hypothetical protein
VVDARCIASREDVRTFHDEDGVSEITVYCFTVVFCVDMPTPTATAAYYKVVKDYEYTLHSSLRPVHFTTCSCFSRLTHVRFAPMHQDGT